MYRRDLTDQNFLFMQRHDKYLSFGSSLGKQVGSVSTMNKLYMPEHEADFSYCFEQYAAPVIAEDLKTDAGTLVNHLKCSHRSVTNVDTAYQGIKKFVAHADQAYAQRPDDPAYDRALHYLYDIIPEIEPLDPNWLKDHMLDILSEPSASAGYPYIFQPHHSKKDLIQGEEFKQTFMDLYYSFSGDAKRNTLLLKRSKFCRYRAAVPPCVAYQKSAIINAGKEDKTRLIWGYPLIMTMLEGMFSYPLMKKSKQLEEENLLYPTSYKMTIFGEGYRRLVDSYADVSTTVLDYSSFDTTVPTYMIKDIFAILEEKIAFADDTQRFAFKACVDYFINTPIVVPQTGSLFVKKHGIPSGSWFTNIVGTYVNLLVMQFIQIKSNRKPILMKAMGDDNLTIGGCYDAFFIEKQASLLGFEVNYKKCYVGKLAGAKYLGRKFTRTTKSSLGWSKPVSNSLLSLALPARSDTVTLFFQRLYCLYIDNPVPLMYKMVLKYEEYILQALQEDVHAESMRSFAFNVFGGDTLEARSFLKTSTKLLSPSDLMM